MKTLTICLYLIKKIIVCISNTLIYIFLFIIFKV
ncbi:unnamed protein product [Arabidopsis halleri]